LNELKSCKVESLVQNILGRVYESIWKYCAKKFMSQPFGLTRPMRSGRRKESVESLVHTILGRVYGIRAYGSTADR
jgi:hypothetical protein